MRLVPRDKVAEGREGGDILSADAGLSEVGGENATSTRGGAMEGHPTAAAAATEREPGRSTRGEQQQQQLLADLVPPAGKPTLPGTGIPFVVVDSSDEAEALGECDRSDDRGGVSERVRGAGRDLSAFERQALQKARARQRERMEEGEPQVREDIPSLLLILHLFPIFKKKTHLVLPRF